eukprot:m.51059 g.51059  ORF g.51059 m.51059 type:complete len:312 (+) comp10708_c0_seq2:261-1196(+)
MVEIDAKNPATLSATICIPEAVGNDDSGTKRTKKLQASKPKQKRSGSRKCSNPKTETTYRNPTARLHVSPHFLAHKPTKGPEDIKFLEQLVGSVVRTTPSGSSLEQLGLLRHVVRGSNKVYVDLESGGGVQIHLEDVLASLLPEGSMPKCSAKAKGALVYGFAWPPDPEVSKEIIQKDRENMQREEFKKSREAKRKAEEMETRAKKLEAMRLAQKQVDEEARILQTKLKRRRKTSDIEKQVVIPAHMIGNEKPKQHKSMPRSQPIPEILGHKGPGGCDLYVWALQRKQRRNNPIMYRSCVFDCESNTKTCM